MNVSHQLIIDQLFERDARPVRQLFSEQSCGPLYPPTSFRVNFYSLTYNCYIYK